MPAYSSHDYPYYNLHAYLRRAFDAFGPRRMFWGTDLTRLPCTYGQGITLFTEELPWLSAADQRMGDGRALCDWLGWPLDGSSAERPQWLTSSSKNKPAMVKPSIHLIIARSALIFANRR